MIRYGLSVIIFLVFFEVSAFTTAVFSNRCGMPYLYASQSCSRNPRGADCATLASTCAAGCADMTGFNASEREETSGAPRRLRDCISWGGTVSAAGVPVAPASGSAAARCEEAERKLNEGGTQDNSVWQSCSNDCQTASNETTNADQRTRYIEIQALCSEKLAGSGGREETPVDPEPQGDDAGTSADADSQGDTTDRTPIADTGSPNNAALTAAYQGLGMTPAMNSSISAGRGVNFSGSGGGSRAGYESVQGVGHLGAMTGPIVPPVRIDDSPVPGGPPQADRASFSPSGGGGGGMMGGGGGSGPSRGGAPGGGPRTSVAGAQLQKQGANQFWAGGSGAAPAGAKPAAGARGTAATNPKMPPVEKAQFGPEYINKSQGGNLGLLRLFGAGQNKLPAERQTQSCRDGVVFCNLELFDFEFKP